jgi:hypothetical protein
MKWPLLFLLFVGILIFAMKASDDVKRDAHSRASDLAIYCKQNPQKVDEIMQSWVDVGVVVGSHGDDIQVEDALWDHAPHDGKVSIGISAYCRAIRGKIDPEATIRLWGYRDGRIKATMKNGSYSD